MPKPEWLKDVEKRKFKRDFKKCGSCIYIGTPVGHVTHNKKKVVRYECSKHKGCYNTEFSICCSDFVPK